MATANGTQGEAGVEGGGGAVVAIVVGTLMRLDQLKDLVVSIRANVSTPWQLCLSDAGSTDGTREWLAVEASRDPRLHVVMEKERAGQAAALNAVFATLRTKFVCWLSDDNVLVGRGLDDAIVALEHDSALGMVGLKVRDRRGPFAASPYIGGITSVGVINVNQGVVRTALLQSLGGFNAAFRDYGIDADLTTRVLLAGHDVIFTRDVAVEHFRNWPESGTPAAARHEERNAAYRARYDELYGGSFPFQPGWTARRAAWKLLRTVSAGRLDPERDRTWLGRPVRDWHNMLAGRLVSPVRELRESKSPFHLRQFGRGSRR